MVEFERRFIVIWNAGLMLIIHYKCVRTVFHRKKTNNPNHLIIKAGCL